jgi:hypothetical protein
LSSATSSFFDIPVLRTTIITLAVDAVAKQKAAGVRPAASG